MASYFKEQELSRNEDGLYICLLNNNTYTSYSGLENHLRRKFDISYSTYLVKFNLDKSENYLECKECGEYCKSLKMHIRTCHKNMTSDDYDKKWKPTKWVCDTTSKILSDLNNGENNSNHKSKTSEQERKERSPFSKEFWKKKDENLNDDEAEKTVSKFAKKSICDRLTTTQLEYWIEKCDGNEEEAKKLYKDRQTTFSKDISIEKYGEVEGLKIWKERQEKWVNTLIKNRKLKCGYSLVSQTLFDSILENYSKDEIENVFYATKNNELYLRYNNDKNYYMYDFCDEAKMKIIEFNGDVYHGNPAIYEANDKPNPFVKSKTASEIWEADLKKLNVAKSEGFELLTIWEKDYRKNPIETLNTCLNFLKI